MMTAGDQLRAEGALRARMKIAQRMLRHGVEMGTIQTLTDIDRPTLETLGKAIKAEKTI